MNFSDHYDIIIVGGGPAGTAAALFAKKAGLRVLILEKDSFPRDKICGDAISGKSIKHLAELNLLDKITALPGTTVERIVFGSPAGMELSIPLSKNKRLPAGFVIKRLFFDRFLFEQVREEGIDHRQRTKVTGLLRENGKIAGVLAKDRATGEIMAFRAHLVFGADGYRSVVAQKLGLYHHDPEHWVVALRCYYKNIKNLDNQLEIHYASGIQPGYFWLFPLEGNIANIGVGMLHKTLRKRKIDLRKSMEDLIRSPQFRERFEGAEPLEKPVGWNLPVASKHRINHGNGFLLLGDAAGLIDPFTGEGIGNAMTSARHAVNTAREAIEQGRYDGEFLSRYDRNLWQEIGNELQVSTRLQKIGRIRFLLNFVINKAARNRQVSDIISGMMSNQIPKKQLANPLFYLKLLFT